MSTSTVTPEIRRFADGVRAALADLPADEVEDVTEGLEADLAESLAEDLRRNDRALRQGSAADAPEKVAKHNE